VEKKIGDIPNSFPLLVAPALAVAMSIKEDE
jgi:hypothetical protein